jgi:polyvinyl alcohol dehydrogenase (cytochrome)
MSVGFHYLAIVLVAWVATATAQGTDAYNHQVYSSDITSENVASLVLRCNLTMCGSATTTPTDLGDGTVLIADFGKCVGRYNITGCSTVWQRNLTDYGFPAGYFARAGMVARGGVAVGGTASNKNLLTPGVPGFGAWVFGIYVDDGRLKWRTQVSTHLYAIITQNFQIVDNSVNVGISSGEAAAPLIPGYPCCSFVGSNVKLDFNSGAIEWNSPNIPSALSGLGKYSGAASWGGRSVIKGAYIYQVAGQLYQEPNDVAACTAANPNDATCVDASVMFDAVIKRKKTTGEIVASFRASSADVWNIACFFGGRIPGCQVGPSFDYDITNVIYSPKTQRIIATSKSGFVFYLDLDLNLLNVSSVVGGSASGGVTWQPALLDDHDPEDLRLFIPNNNGAGRNLTLLDGTVINKGAWAALDGHGNVKWITPALNEYAYGSLALTNDVVFGSTRFRGDLVALNAVDGSVLATWGTKGSMIAAPLILKDKLVWATGPGNILSGPLVDQKDLLVFGLPDDDHHEGDDHHDDDHHEGEGEHDS